LHEIDHIKQEIHMSATRADLDAAIDAQTTAITKALDDLKAAVAAGQVATPEDFTAEITKIQALTGVAVADDPGATPAA
jgi:hypothetical protein